MRHLNKTIKLGRTSAHRDALLASLVCNLCFDKRIQTTVAKAKAARSVAEKMVTLGKKATLASRRRAISIMRRPEAVKILFENIAPEFKDRAGGYTRIMRLGRRSGDGAELALLEWVTYVPQAPKKKEPKDEKKAATAEGAKPAEKKEKKAAKKEGQKAEKAAKK
jgi:large subunit ribosomal protein L17